MVVEYIRLFMPTHLVAGIDLPKGAFGENFRPAAEGRAMSFFRILSSTLKLRP
jgi:hypothetical protein